MLERDCLLLRDDEQLPVLHFPDWETLPYDLFSPHPDIISARLATLASLPNTQRGLLIVPVSTLLQRLSPTEFIHGHSMQLQVGIELPMLQFRQNLINTGYDAVDAVYQTGQFAQRGALLDVFPSGSANPLRIEWLDDEIASLRSFDAETQRSSTGHGIFSAAHFCTNQQSVRLPGPASAADPAGGLQSCSRTVSVTRE
jgi:transcription-repair coupling factor (superfamily II helicase)